MKINTFRALTTALVLLSFFSANAQTPTEFKIPYEKFTLDNGLEVILHEDHSDPIVALATMMHVGSNREKPGKTGFAHFFEHMSFNDSENVPVGANRKMIPEWGGSRNGGTWSDGTVYYEVVPKDAFEKILWIDSDRFGYMINTVTEAALEREKQVVKNEKRQRVDNAPYGYTNEIIRKNLYPEGHPYNWTVIGQLPDLQSATIDDVKEFYAQYYGAGNASLVIAGDIDVAETKRLVEQWFGEISKGPEVAEMKPMPVTLSKSKSLYFEDNFAKLPELRMVFPSVEEYHEDSYALNILGQLLSDGKTSPFYQVIVEEEQLAPEAGSYQSGSEIAGEFVFRVRGNEGVDLDTVKAAIDKALARFEKNGVDPRDLKRIQAGLETDLYQGIETILDKAFQLVKDNEFIGDPGYIAKTAQLTNAVTAADVQRVYEKYIKGQHYVMTSVVPKGAVDLAVAESEEAEVWIEEVKQGVTDEEVGQGEEAEYEKTPSKYDRSEPEFGELPLFESPTIWNTELSNKMKVYGIENTELPSVEFDLTIPGGHFINPMDKAGLAALTGDMLLQGTKNRTSAELEEAIGLLGASLNIYVDAEDLHITGSCLSANFSKLMDLTAEVLAEPRWDEAEFQRLKKALETELKGREANPSAIAFLNFNKLMYGDAHILGKPIQGTLATIKNILMEDLKEYYANMSPTNAVLHIAGSLDQAKTVEAMAEVSKQWNIQRTLEKPKYELPKTSKADTLYFIDVPDAKQSVLLIGKLALSATNPNYNNLQFANEILGGGSSGRLFQTLRIEKGYTYGVYSRIYEREAVSPLYVNGSVRANATLPSLKIIKNMLSDYGDSFSEDDVALTQNKVVKNNTRAYESLGAKLGILKNISKYGLPEDYLEQDQEELMAMDLQDFRSIIDQYMQEEDMVYVVVGDKATQWGEVKKLGRPVVELDVDGERVE
ncbi:MAG: pitrilysin family protein [Pricia sp.]